MTSEPSALLDFLSSREGDVLQFARDLIRIPSPNPPGNEKAVADFVLGRLTDLGVQDVTRLGVDGDRPNLIVRVSGGRPGPTIMFSGHLDTKPAGDLDAWETDPWDPILEDGDLRGLGSGDMKVAIAGMVYAAAALGSLDGFAGEVVLVLTADEEAGSAVGSKWLAEGGHLKADVAVICEPSGITTEWQSIHLVSRGAALFKVEITGTQMHSSVSDRLPGINATVKMAQLIQKMNSGLKAYLTYQDHPLCPTGPTVNVGVMASAGVYYGVLPGRAEFACDIRTLPGMTEDVLMADIQRFLDDAMSEDPDLKAKLVWELMAPAAEIDSDQPVIQALQTAAEQVLGFTPDLDAFPGGTDAAYIQMTAGIPCVASFGPGFLPRAHSPNEHLAATGAIQSAKIYALAAFDYLSTP